MSDSKAWPTTCYCCGFQFPDSAAVVSDPNRFAYPFGPPVTENNTVICGACLRKAILEHRSLCAPWRPTVVPTKLKK